MPCYSVPVSVEPAVYRVLDSVLYLADHAPDHFNYLTESTCSVEGKRRTQ